MELHDVLPVLQHSLGVPSCMTTSLTSTSLLVDLVEHVLLELATFLPALQHSLGVPSCMSASLTSASLLVDSVELHDPAEMDTSLGPFDLLKINLSLVFSSALPLALFPL